MTADIHPIAQRRAFDTRPGKISGTGKVGLQASMDDLAWGVTVDRMVSEAADLQWTGAQAVPEGKMAAATTAYAKAATILERAAEVARNADRDELSGRLHIAARLAANLAASYSRFVPAGS